MQQTLDASSFAQATGSRADWNGAMAIKQAISTMITQIIVHYYIGWSLH
jgi:hypothetical protein